MPDWRGIPITDGTAQADRLPFALREGYFLVDEMSFEQLLAMSSELGQVIAFYGQDGERRGSWSEMFHGNEAALMALILAKDTRRMQAEFARCLEEGLESCVAYAYRLARFIDFCLRKLQRLESRAALEFSERITVLVRERLASRLGELGRITGALEQAGPLAFSPDFGDFDPAWGMRAPQEPVRSPGGVSGVGSPDVRRVFQAFSTAIAYLKSLVGPYLAESLQTRDHEPAMGLFVAFLRLFGATQTQLNAFTERHLDFYYRRVLGTAPRPAVGDRALLALRTSGVARSVTIDAGSRWLASGPAPGDVRVFTSRAPMVARPARVSALCTMHLQRDRRISAEREFGYVTRIKSARLPVVAPDLAAGPRQAWPLFGTQHVAGAVSVAQDAAFGFAVASPALLLKEGTRRIRLSLHLEDPTAPEEAFERDAHLDDDAIAKLFASQLRSAAEVFGELSTLDAEAEAKELAKKVTSEEVRRALRDTVREGRNRLYDLLLRAAWRRLEPKQERRFRFVFGALFRRHLLGGPDTIDEDYRREILTRADEVLPEDSRKVVRGLLETGHTGLFERLLGDAFEVSLTTEAGWHRVRNCVVSRPGPEHGSGSGEGAGLCFSMTLAPDVAPVVAYRGDVHGGDLRTGSPVIRLRIAGPASFCAYSLLIGFVLRSVVVDTDVRGVRNLCVSSSVGPLDTSGPFNPFGPLPTVGSYLTVGSYELARKRVQSVRVNLEWADLPRDYGGFAAHYAGYARDFASGDFTVEQSVLRDGTWLPGSGRQRPAAALFAPVGTAERLHAEHALEVQVLDYLRPLAPSVTEEDFDLSRGARDGFFRFTLSGPDGAFGHAAYPLLLSGALARNLRRRAKKQTAVPNPPYTPLLAGVTLDYASSDVVPLAGAEPGQGDDVAEAVFHLHPFGHARVRPGGGRRPAQLFPCYDTDGNLFIGLDGDVGGGALTLLFHLCAETHSRTAFESPDLAWFYLAADGWRRLPASRVISDTTRGLMRSGIVTLDLPADLERRGGVMPAGPAWLRVGVNAHLEYFPGLYAVHANGLEVSRLDDDGTAPAAIAHATGALEWRSEASIPGLESVLQVGECFGGAAAETREQFRTRVSERLRHKMRAVTPWDYERLVLERFPRISKVKCFPGMVTAAPQPAPGNVLVVVVPKADDGDPCAHPMASVLELVEIRAYVAALASAFVHVEVRNPTYERVQVRCAVKFAGVGNDARYTQKLNAELTGYLSPWTAQGYRARFGWRIRRDDVEGFIRAREYVEFLTDFSMLHVAESDAAVYSLGDTARPEGAAIDRKGIRPRYPWSLALPVRRHHIQTLRAERVIDAEVTGVDELEVGATFIVDGSS